ncbi:hypothetical protein OG693_39735 (plasmid) [Streptomyces sp. NBC_01259]|uniref:hypothetical protein n=1 Tax=Streptomyces sp. NBC_01259 TaxID=2903800 RepID=UPI002F90C563
MRTRLTAAALTAAALLALSACSSDTRYTTDDCAAAITDTSTKTDRPTECANVSDDDYETLLLGHLLKHEGLDNLDESPGDLLDYAEDGTVDQ